MNRSFLAAAALAAPVVLAWASGCGEDEVFDRDAGGGVLDGGSPPDSPTTADAEVPLGCGDAGGVVPRALVTMTSIGDGGKASELAAVNLDTQATDGVLGYPASFGMTWSLGADPYLLQQDKDIVTRLDAREPWKTIASWNVAGADRTDGSAEYADPTSITVPACGKGYVVRFTRNTIAVIDTTQKGEGNLPLKWIDLTPLLQSGDADGRVDATSALWVPSKRRLYVLLANIDITKVALDGMTSLCTTTRPSIVGIDVDKDEVVSLGGGGPGGSILLEGYNPPLGPSFVYDPELDRLLVLEGGCNESDAGAAGPVARRRIEEVRLATGQVRTLVSLDDKPFPSGLAYLDGKRAAVAFAFSGEAYMWNPEEATLGAPIPGGLDAIAHDGKGNVIGARTVFGTPNKVEVVRVPYTDAGAIDAAAVTTVSTNPFRDNTGFLGGLEVWPRP